MPPNIDTLRLLKAMYLAALGESKKIVVIKSHACFAFFQKIYFPTVGEIIIRKMKLLSASLECHFYQSSKD